MRASELDSDATPSIKAFDEIFRNLILAKGSTIKIYIPVDTVTSYTRSEKMIYRRVARMSSNNGNEETVN